MSATIIQFPADRCRQPASAIELAEREAFARAAGEHAAGGVDGPTIHAMMTLALEGACVVTKAKASGWLLAEYDIFVA